MRFSYSPDIETKICTHEDSMVEVFSALVETYRSKFDKYGCDIRLEQYWYNNGNVSLKRLPFSNGYTCAFSCSAEKNGKPLCVDVVEGNTLTVSWPISSIARNWSLNPLKKSSLTVSLFDDTEDAVNDSNEFLRILGYIT